MIKMLHPDIALAVDSGTDLPMTVANCVSRALEYHINQSKEAKAKFWKAKKKEKAQNKPTHRNNWLELKIAFLLSLKW